MYTLKQNTIELSFVRMSFDVGKLLLITIFCVSVMFKFCGNKPFDNRVTNALCLEDSIFKR